MYGPKQDPPEKQEEKEEEKQQPPKTQMEELKAISGSTLREVLPGEYMPHKHNFDEWAKSVKLGLTAACLKPASLVAIITTMVPEIGKMAIEDYAIQPNETNTISNLLALLKPELAKNNTQRAAQIALKTVKIKEDECAETFANRVNTLVSKGYTTLGALEKDLLKMESYKDGYGLDMQQAIRTAKCKNFNDCVVEAVEEELWIIKKETLLAEQTKTNNELERTINELK
jgi:hypothetical protein